MIPTWVIPVGAFLSGGILGAGAAVFVLKKKYEAQANAEIEEVKKYYADKQKLREQAENKAHRENMEKLEKLASKYKSNDTGPFGEPIDTKKARLVDPKPPKVELRDVLDREKKRNEGRTVVRTMRDRDPEPCPPGEDPIEWERQHANVFMITIEEFLDGHEDVDPEKEVVHYYAGDKTLADDQEMVIPGVLETVGEHALKNFGWGSEEEHIVHVRNLNTGLDLEVVYHDGKYSEDVLGDWPDDDDYEPITPPKNGAKFRSEE